MSDKAILGLIVLFGVIFGGMGYCAGVSRGWRDAIRWVREREAQYRRDPR